MEALESFSVIWREVALWSSFDSPFLAKLLGVAVSPALGTAEIRYISLTFAFSVCVMEMLEHGSLQSYLEKSPPLSSLTRRKIARDIASGIAYLHSLTPPVLHRDLKSPNVLVWYISVRPLDLELIPLVQMASASDGAPVMAKIIDFGTCVRTYETSGRCVDNPVWLAPEIMCNLPYNEKSDMFSFGIILWEILTQQRPYAQFRAEFTSVLEDRILSGTRPQIPDNCPPAWSALISECLSVSPQTRPSASMALLRLSS